MSNPMSKYDAARDVTEMVDVKETRKGYETAKSRTTKDANVPTFLMRLLITGCLAIEGPSNQICRGINVLANVANDRSKRKAPQSLPISLRKAGSIELTNGHPRTETRHILKEKRTTIHQRHMQNRSIYH